MSPAALRQLLRHPLMVLRHAGPVAVAILLALDAFGLARDGNVLPAAGIVVVLALLGVRMLDLRRAERARRASEASVRDAARRIAAVAQAQAVIGTGARELLPAMRLVAANACDIVGADGAVVEIADGEDMVYRAAVGTAASHFNRRVPIEGSLSGRALRGGRTLHCVDAEHDARVNAEACRLVGLRSMICVPLRHGPEAIGVLKVLSARPHAFGDRDERTLELLAGMAASAVHRAGTEHQLAAAHAVVGALAAARTFDEGLLGTLEALGRRLGWEAGAVWLDDGLSPGGPRRVATWQAPEVAASTYLAAPGLAAPRVSGGPRWVQRMADLGDDPARVAAAAGCGLTTALFVPIPAGGEVCGVLEIATRAEHTHDGRQLELVATAATQLGEFIRRRRLEDGAAVHLANLEAVVELSRALSRVSSEEARAVLCRKIRAFTGVTQVALQEPDHEGALVVTGQDGGLIPEGYRVPAGEPSLTRDVFEAGQGRFVADLVADAGASPQFVELTGLRSVHLQPIIRDDRVVGVLTLSSQQLRAEDAGGLGLLMHLLAAEAANGLAIADLVQALDARARTDQLTGVPNRRRWDEELPRELERARRTGAPFTVGILDLDHFKAYNDTHGHPAGDRLLRAAAAGWSERLRTTDLLARYGGEEFAVALPGCDAGAARQVAEQLRAALPEGTTVSIGVAAWDGIEDAEALVARADAALYRAKGEGRDRVAVA